MSTIQTFELYLLSLGTCPPTQNASFQLYSQMYVAVQTHATWVYISVYFSILLNITDELLPQNLVIPE